MVVGMNMRNIGSFQTAETKNMLLFKSFLSQNLLHNAVITIAFQMLLPQLRTSKT